LERGFGHVEKEVQCGADRGAVAQVEVLTSQGKAAPVACREAGISQQSYYRWRADPQPRVLQHAVQGTGQLAARGRRFDLVTG